MWEMSTRTKLILSVTLGFGVLLVAAPKPLLDIRWRGMLMLSGGWLMAIGSLCQVRLYAQPKDVLYYLMGRLPVCSGSA